MKQLIITKKKFFEINKKFSNNLFFKKDFFILYKKFLEKTLKKRIAHQTTWFGEPVLQLPQDLLIQQELIYKTKPEYFIEIGVAWSGSLLYFSSIFNSIGGKKIIGVDTFIPKKIFQNILRFKKLKNYIKLIKGSSTDIKVLNKIKSIIGVSKKVIIHLDSDHSHENVLKELNLYSKLIKKGSYLICGDTHIEFFKINPHGKNKNYSKNNNSMTALKVFLKTKEGKKFKQDFSFQNRYFLTLNPSGYLKKIKN
jgi:cephalosporin hydroxylase